MNRLPITLTSSPPAKLAGQVVVKNLECRHCPQPCILGGLIQHEPQLEKLFCPIRYDGGETIFQEGMLVTGCYILCQGKAKLMKRTCEGKRQLFRLVNVGEMLGVSDLFSCQAGYLTCAKTLGEAHVKFVEKGRFVQLVQEHPTLGLRLLERFSKEIIALRERLVESSYSSVREQMIHLLLALEEKHSRDVENGYLMVNVSREELAEMTGVARETVSRHLSELKQKGLIAFAKQGIIILDDAGLRRWV